jgi:hypothetical protein
MPEGVAMSGELPQIDGSARAVVQLELQFQLPNHIGR